MSGNLPASVRQRLLDRSKEVGQDFNLTLTRYALERLLYRISQSKYVNNFMLKGAMVFDLWFDIPHRPTRDADLLGFGSPDIPHLAAVFKEICRTEVEPDGLVFHEGTVQSAEIRKESNYSGVRVTMLAELSAAKITLQVDIGFGDAVTPGPDVTEYKVLLKGFPAPRMQMYPSYTVVAEKLQALTVLGLANTRLKDYFDLWILAMHKDFDGATLSKAVQATFERRGTPLPDKLPFGLSDDFAQDGSKQSQWGGFLKRNKLSATDLGDVVLKLREHLWPVLQAVQQGELFRGQWNSGGPWH